MSPPKQQLQQRDAVWESKCFEFAREISRFCELAHLEEERIVPQFILVGDQSSGKTTLLCRLAGIPLGFTTNGTGTRRPFEYNLIRDESQAEPLITVDSEQVTETSLLSRMTKLNGTTQDGFRNEAVSVKIVWKDVATNMMIVDMPGMKDGDSGPEDMVLERLRHPNVIPVVVLESRDMGSVHYVYKVLERATPPRDCSSLVAIVNKCDEKMNVDGGEWADGATFRGWWKGAQQKNFKAIFCTGWPKCASRNSDNPQQQKRQLAESLTAEDDMVKAWEQKLGAALPEGCRSSMGLAKFQQYLNRDQASRLGELVGASGPKVERDHREYSAKLAELEQNSTKKLKKKVADLMHVWSSGVQEFVDGHFDCYAFRESRATAEEDAQWLHEESTQCLWSLRNREEHPPVKAQELLEALDSKLRPSAPVTLATPRARDSSAKGLKDRAASIATDSGSLASEGSQERGSWVAMLQPWVPSVSVGLLGKAAFERDIELVLQFALIRSLEHVLTEFTQEFAMNIRACPSEDSGNKVVLLFMGRVMSETLHPLVDVLSVLLQRHLDSCIRAPFKRYVGCEELKEMTVASEFDEAATQFVQQLISDFNVELHKRLEEQRLRLKGRGRTSAEGRALANLQAGMAPEDEEAAPEEARTFEAQAREFLEMSLETLKGSGPLLAPGAELYRFMLAEVRQPAPATPPYTKPPGRSWTGRTDAGTGSQGNDGSGSSESGSAEGSSQAKAFLDDLKLRFQPLHGAKWAGMSMSLLHRHVGYELVSQVIGFRDIVEYKVEALKLELQRKLPSEMAWTVGNVAIAKLAKENTKQLKYTRRVLQVLDRARSIRRELLGDLSDSEADEDEDA